MLWQRRRRLSPEILRLEMMPKAPVRKAPTLLLLLLLLLLLETARRMWRLIRGPSQWRTRPILWPFRRKGPR